MTVQAKLYECVIIFFFSVLSLNLNLDMSVSLMDN